MTTKNKQKYIIDDLKTLNLSKDLVNVNIKNAHTYTFIQYLFGILNAKNTKSISMHLNEFLRYGAYSESFVGHANLIRPIIKRMIEDKITVTVDDKQLPIFKELTVDEDNYLHVTIQNKVFNLLDTNTVAFKVKDLDKVNYRYLNLFLSLKTARKNQVVIKREQLISMFNQGQAIRPVYLVRNHLKPAVDNIEEVMPNLDWNENRIGRKEVISYTFNLK